MTAGEIEKEKYNERAKTSYDRKCTFGPGVVMAMAGRVSGS